MELFKLFGSIFVDSEAAENSISKAGDKADGLGKKLGKGIGVAAKFGVGLAAGAAVAGAGLFTLATKSAETADVIDKLSERTGINREELQRWKYAADQSGADIGKLETGIKKLSDVMDGASTGNEKNVESFNKLGISLQDLQTKSQEDIFEEVMMSLADMEQGAARNALGNDLLGKSYTEMLPLLNAGSGGMKDLKDRANELGLVMSEEAVKANVVFGDTMDDVKDSLGMVGIKIGTKLLPMFQSMLDWVLANLPTIQSVAGTVFDAVSNVVKKTADVFKDNILPRLQEFWTWLEPKLPAIKEGFETAFNATKDAIEDTSVAIQDASKWFQEHWAILQPILAGVAGGAIAFYSITGAIALYNAALLFSMGLGPVYIAMTAGMAAITGVFGATLALVTSPIFLVALAIAAVIAIGVLLYKNWDTIVIKAKALGVFLSAVFAKIKDAVVQKVVELTAKAIDKFNELKTKAIVKFAEILAAAGTKFNAIKSKIMDPINAAKDKVKSAVDKIKGFFTGMKLNLPKIKVPSFSLKNWSKNPLDWIGNMPSIGINWNAKGALFTKPTVFNTPMGLQGFGEAGPEAALPLTSSVLGMIGDKIAQTMDMNSGSQTDNRPIILQTFLDGKMIAEVIEPSMSKLLAKKMNNAGRGEFA